MHVEWQIMAGRIKSPRNKDSNIQFSNQIKGIRQSHVSEATKEHDDSTSGT